MPPSRRFIGFFLTSLTLLASTPAAERTAPVVDADFAAPVTQSMRRVPPDAGCFLYEGRIDFSDQRAPLIVWQGCRISLDFDGRQLDLIFDSIGGPNFFDGEVDGTSVVLELKSGGPQRLGYPVPLGPGRHHLVLAKRSEAAVGAVRFRGVEIAAHARAELPAPPVYKLKAEFFGDSITAGACSEDGPADQWENRRTHNSARSYAARTAAALAADYRNTAVSGMGVAIGWVSVKIADVWDRTAPDAAASRADLQSWQPDVAFVNLGENDGSFTTAKKLPFPADFTAKYVEFVRSLRTTYPHAHIVLLRGGMYNGAQNPELRKAWEAAVHQLESTDPAVRHFVFTHWSMNHPRVPDAQAMADELVAWWGKQSFR